MEEMQLQFPFMPEGALYAYNSFQKPFVQKAYFSYLEQEGHHDHLLDFTEFYVVKWAGSNLAKEFSDTYRPQFEEPVQWYYENDKVWDRLIDNKLHENHPIYKVLEDKLNQ